MEILRYKYMFAMLIITVSCANAQDMKNKRKGHGTDCPYSKIIEDVFKIHNKTTQKGIFVENNEKSKIFLQSVGNITSDDDISDLKPHQNEQVKNIIASINRIKNQIATDDNVSEEEHLNKAIILNIPAKPNLNTESQKYGEGTIKHSNENLNAQYRVENPQTITSILKNAVNAVKKKQDKNTNATETKTKIDDKLNYVEILTIEPNNTSKNNASTNIIEILKHLMPMFNSTMTKELHNITVIERDRGKNHSFSSVKNISTIVVTYCDKENLTKTNVTFDSERETFIKLPQNETIDDDYYIDDTSGPLVEADYDEVIPESNLTFAERKDILEASEYGMQKMHELYSVMEPKLYSLGLWLDDTNPARYVAAFNAPAEDLEKYSRYGYASLQAATKLKQLIGGDNENGSMEGRMEEGQFPTVSALRQSPLMQHCPIRGLPKCPPASKRYRTHDGTCNNFNRPRWGSTMTPVQRFQPPLYSDGLQAPRRSVFGAQLPSAREISSLVHEDQNVETPSVTHLLMQWGQFLDHDVTSSSQSRGFNGSVPRCCKDGGRDFVPKDLLHPECFPISVPASDPFYGPRGVRCLDFVRSSPAPRDDCALGWREQLNQVSAYIDASPLYGSSARSSDKLRLFRNGMLQYGRVQQRRPLLPPEKKDELCRGGAVSTDCFKSGDARVNEHPGLVAAHIVWLRQHNRMAQELAHLNPHWSDEKIYQETRKIVGAMIQHITYREFLPIVLGDEVMRIFDLETLRKGYYKNYNPKTNASPASSFGSAAFRFGHSLVQPSMVRFDRFHRPMSNNVSLHAELTNPSNIWSMGAVDRLLLGMVNQPIQKRDEFITKELTNHLFQTPQFSFGMDLAAINIQRGRDHGVPPYTAWREPCGLSSISKFEDLLRVMPTRAVRRLQSLYRHVDDVDLFTGGMAERPVVGGLVGPTFACIIAQQFANLRKGDRFWYENGGFESSLTPAQLQQIRRISFAQVLCRTLDNIDDIQPFVFLSADSPENHRISCLNGLLNNFDLSPWTEVGSDSNNDISKAEESNNNIVSQRPPSTAKPKATTTKPKTTTSRHQDKVEQAQHGISNKIKQKLPMPILSAEDSTRLKNSSKIKPQRFHDNSTTAENKLTNLTKVSTNMTDNKQKIDDKLDFMNKSRLYDRIDRIDERHDMTRKPTKNKQHYEYDDDEDDVQSVQSVVINNVAHKRPSSYNRPVISVTENIDKYTYLINYVPRPTQSWRQTTRRPYKDRDVIKVTYQTYDDTYRRPNKPYYNNRQDDGSQTDSNYRNSDLNDPITLIDDMNSSARSNDDDTLPSTVSKLTIDKSDKSDSTTDNLYKLVTFGYVGTYKGNDINKLELKKPITDKPDINKDDLQDSDTTKSFSTYDSHIKQEHSAEDINTDKHTTKSEVNGTVKLSTFFHFDTTTKPYDKQQRPTRLNDEAKLKYEINQNSNFADKYIKLQEIIRENYNSPGWPQYGDAQERTADKLAILEDLDVPKTVPTKVKTKPRKPPANSAKTPSVAFEVIPSENSPSRWAVYEETSDLLDGSLQKMPTPQTDPQASREIPKPMTFLTLKLRNRPGRI